ncbi:MAG: hypothetical protein LUQ09_06275 [Methanomassiliicoccales archaeon]|nr:hypothetical protein [Methanomassiliicoccales archaeon]
MGVNITWVAMIWGLAVGILIGDVLYYLTDEIPMFLLTVPCAIIGYFLGRRYQRKTEMQKEFVRRRH